MWAGRGNAASRSTRPATREYYLLRSIFEEHFPSPSALATVPKVTAGLPPSRMLMHGRGSVLAPIPCQAVCGREMSAQG